MYESQLINKICGILSGISATVIPASDFTEERDDVMVVVGTASTENVLLGYHDYKIGVEILIDSYISEDNDASVFYSVKQAVDTSIFNITREFPTFTSFGDVPVVGVVLNNDDISFTDKSNRCVKHLDVFISYDEETN